MTAIDAHAHLDFPEFDQDRDEVVARANAAGVSCIINVGASIKGSLDTVKLAKAYPCVYGVVGVHPHDAEKEGREAYARIRELAGCEKVVGIGEIGLDYYRNLSPAASQQGTFRSLLGLAKETGLPVVLHSREAEADTLAIAREFMPIAAVVHCFSGNGHFMRECLEMGFYLSFTANITYKKAVELRKVVSSAPLDRIMVETDCPYLSPEGRRGKRNEPSMVIDVLRQVAQCKGITEDEAAHMTTQNAKRFFKLP